MSVEQIRQLVDSAALFTLEEEQGSALARARELAPPLWDLPPPITVQEFQDARITPDCIIEKLLYADVGSLVAPGGTGKTTLILHIAIHIVLGIPLFGLQIFKPGPVLIITAEDSREILVARLRALADAMRLNEAERTKVMQGVLLSDVSGQGFRVTEIRDQIVRPAAEEVEALIQGCRALRPVLVVIDPAVSFGVGESRVNDAEQGLIEAARRLKRMIGCCVLYVHHSGKQNARDKVVDQYAGRGGSAFADGSRMVLVLQNVSPDEWGAATGKDLEEGETGLTLARPKISYCAPQDEILICRSGYRFERTERIRTTKEVEQERADHQVLHFLTEQLGAGKYHNKSTLEAHGLGLPRAEIREAVDRLLTSRRVEIQNMPPDKERRRGGARTYLHPMASPVEYGDHRS